MFDYSGISEATSAAVAALTRRLSAELGAPAEMADPGRVDLIRELERLVCVATAAQAALTAELDEGQRATQAALGVPPAQQGRGVGAQVALARRESHHRGQRHLALAKIVRAELPRTWEAWRAGRITEWKATLVARETACLSREDRAAVDEAVASDPVRLERMGDRELAHACQQTAYRLDPESYVVRRRQAERDRNVTLRPAPDAMVWLTALLPVKEGVASYAALTRAAESARALGDTRSRGQVMADTLAGSVLDAAARRRDSQTDWDADPAGATTTRPTAQVSLGVVMTHDTLFGTSDEPALVEGYGPIPAELAREIVAGACDQGEQVWIRRLYTSPTTGELIAMESRGRAFRGSLARFIRLRDRVCRTPWCDAPIRHGDHPTGVEAGGVTTGLNGQGLCEACNYAKQAPGWVARAGPDGDGHTIETTLPTGHSYRSRAPALARIGYTTPVIDYVLAG